MTRTGVWLIGARGNVGTMAIVGARAIATGHATTAGLVTERPPCTTLKLPGFDDLVFGGHDITTTGISSRAQLLAANGTPPSSTVEAVSDELERIDDRIRTGTITGSGSAIEALAEQSINGESLSSMVEQLRRTYRVFVEKHDLGRLVVVNVASTEQPLEQPARFDSRATIERAIETDDRTLPASAVYAYAALLDGHPYINFTPSTGASLGGLQELAIERNVPHMGRDGKTGETLVKSALAPLFAGRNLRVTSWSGHNILGNNDGRVLEDETHQAGKLESKGGVLEELLDGTFHNQVRIDYAPPLGDWKTAWDDIRFSGFLDTEMSMRFTWDGSDSALAAPLVLDLVRLIAHADEHGEGGPQPQLASFFKSPLGVDEHDLSRQFSMLERYVERHAEEHP
ncbi:inositol-3-phosphate synthase [Halocatena halophila]|uniref:inositol-3-phosphate synthase n=1 Tax=Halocatena halophila TaxID=2814576 RepID=UPI002ED6AE4C